MEKGTAPLVLITLFEPASPRTGIDKKDLPKPQWKTKPDMNKAAKTKAKALGIKTETRGNSFDNGSQPFTGLRHKHITFKVFFDLVEGSQARFVGVRDEEKYQFKLEFKQGQSDNPNGLLSKAQLKEYLRTFGESVEYLKINGLWLNPGKDGPEANLVLRAAQEDDKIKVIDLPIKKNGATHVELPKNEVAA